MFLGRIAATMRREVPVERIRSLLQAGGGPYEDILAADQLRTELVAAEITPLMKSPVESGQLLCAWVAYALQSLADEFVAGEGLTGPPPASGFVTHITAEQVRVLASQVPAWVARTRPAAADPGYDVAAEVPLPAALPVPTTTTTADPGVDRHCAIPAGPVVGLRSRVFWRLWSSRRTSLISGYVR